MSWDVHSHRYGAEADVVTYESAMTWLSQRRLHQWAAPQWLLMSRSVCSVLDFKFQPLAFETLDSQNSYVISVSNLVTGVGKFEHITPVLRDILHWLPVE